MEGHGKSWKLREFFENHRTGKGESRNFLLMVYKIICHRSQGETYPISTKVKGETMELTAFWSRKFNKKTLRQPWFNYRSMNVLQKCERFGEYFACLRMNLLCSQTLIKKDLTIWIVQTNHNIFNSTLHMFSLKTLMKNVKLWIIWCNKTLIIQPFEVYRQITVLVGNKFSVVNFIEGLNT